MNNTELENIWKSYDQKVDQVLTLNREIALSLSRQKLNRQISKLYRPKWAAIIIGIPYTLLLLAVTAIAFMAKAYLVCFGFGAISLLMIAILLQYFNQLFLIGQIKNDEEVLPTQQQLSKLRLSSFDTVNLAVFQLPFWSLCWISINALRENPFIYGGINLLVFLALSYAAYWLYQKVSYKTQDSRIRDFFLSGNEWEPIAKSTAILEQIKEYESLKRSTKPHSGDYL